MNEVETQKIFYHRICNKSEIERIFNVRDARDHLLKLRADTLVDNMRLFRVYRNKALLDEENWSLENSFDDSHYSKVLERLPEDLKTKCEKVCYGDIFSNDPNGMIFHTKFGVITTISESLRFFLKFCHLAILDFESDVPMKIRLNSLRIAIRTMLKTEAMDFLMDPRGIIPSEVAFAIHAPINLQMQFIAGHEFAHFILDHLDKRNIVEQPIFHAISDKDHDYKLEKVYNNSQKNEFDADLKAILIPKYSDVERAELLDAALLWFGCLELYQTALDVMFPQCPWGYKSHPTARDRYENLITNIPTPKAFDTSAWKEFHDQIDHLKAAIQEDISLNFEAYETYGSAYLDKPNTEWRGKELIDRVDYY